MSERPGLTEAEREASRWIVRLESPDVSLKDHQRFRAWLAASEENQRAYRALSDTWDKLDLLKKDYAPASAPGRSASPPASPRTAIASRRALLLGGGSAAVIAVGAVAVWLASPSSTFAASYETAIGGRETARLQDGSVVELNADTAIAVTYNGDLRSCALSRGEALFTVAADGRPFEVRTAFGTFVAEGTSFVVKLMDDAARASVLEGEVRAERAGARRLIASASNEIVLTREEALVSEISEERAAARTAWREGVLVFDGETLEEAAADVARQTGLRFAFEDEEVANLRVGGLIDARDGQAFVALVESNLGLRAEPQTDGAVLLSR